MRNLLEEGSSIFEVSNDAMMLDYAFSYSQFLINEQFDDRMLFLHTLNKDTKLLEGGQLISLNEGFISGVIEFIRKIVKSIADVIERFIADIRKMIGADSKFLANNESKIRGGDIIKKGEKWPESYAFAKAEEAITNDHTFAIKKNTNWNLLKDHIEQWDTIPKYVTGVHLGEISLGDDENVRFKDKLFKHWCGEPITIIDEKVTKELRGRMFDFCYKGYNRVLDMLDIDKKTLNDINDDLKQNLDRMKQQSTQEEKQREEEKNAEEQAKAETSTQESTLDNTMQYYFNEWTPGTAGEDAQRSTATNGGSIKAAVHAGVDTQSTTGSGTAPAGTDKNDITDDQKMANVIKSFYNASTDLISCRMKICSKMYRQYMKIMRWYVSVYDEKKHGGEVNLTDKDKKSDTNDIPKL